MLDWHPLFTGTPDAASDLALELGRHGLRSFVQDRDGAIQMHGGSRERCGVVLVPPEETEAAKAVATRWHAQNELDAIRLTARIRRVLLLGSLPPAAWIVPSLALGRRLESQLGWLGGAWLVSVILAAQMEHRIMASRREAAGALDRRDPEGMRRPENSS